MGGAMNTGLLIHYTGDLEDGVRAAIRAYKTKLGVIPNECHVNAGALDADREIGGVRVVRSTRILPHKYWIGRSEESTIDLPLFRGVMTPSLRGAR